MKNTLCTGTALGFQIDGAADFFCALNPCQITSCYIFRVLLKWLMQYPKKLTVRLHHAHPSNAAPVVILHGSKLVAFSIKIVKVYLSKSVH